MNPSDIEMIDTLELLSDAAQPKPLFVLLHDAGGAALDMLALALSNAHDGLVGRVLAFGGGYAVLPTAAPKLITLHLLHGQLDQAVTRLQTCVPLRFWKAACPIKR